MGQMGSDERMKHFNILCGVFFFFPNVSMTHYHSGRCCGFPHVQNRVLKELLLQLFREDRPALCMHTTLIIIHNMAIIIFLIASE